MSSMEDLGKRVQALVKAAYDVTNLECYSEISVASLAAECWEIEEAVSALLQKLSEIRHAQAQASTGEEYVRGTDECPICLEPLYAVSSVSTPCDHKFHLHCVLYHLRLPNASSGKVVCPLCRLEIDEADVLSSRNGFELDAMGYGRFLDDGSNFDETVQFLLMSQGAAFDVVGALGLSCLTARVEHYLCSMGCSDLKRLAHAVHAFKERQRRIVLQATEHLVLKFEEINRSYEQAA